MRSGCQVLPIDGLPDLAQRRQAKCEDHAAALDSPGHARLLETLREHRFAAGFGVAAADRQTEAAILLVACGQKTEPNSNLRWWMELRKALGKYSPKGWNDWRSIESQWGTLVCFLESTGSTSCREKDSQVCQEVSGGDSLLFESRSSARRSSGKFHGKKDVGLAGAFPPLAAQAAK